MLLYKYFRAEWALRLLKTKRVKVTMLSEVNDPFEWLPGVKAPAGQGYEESDAWLERFRLAVLARRGMVCFSETRTDPVIWAHYADYHKGIALEFDYIDDPARTDIVKIEYSPERVCLDPSVITEAWRESEAAIRAMRKTLTAKHSSWRYEQEYRVIVRLSGCIEEEGKYYIPLPDDFLVRVILGIKCPHTVSDVQALLRTYGFEDVIVTRARRSLDKFEILCDEATH
ncbi:MAG: DUF2971 domain-containing protein [Candidatus Methanospirareceae archaeon]